MKNVLLNLYFGGYRQFRVTFDINYDNSIHFATEPAILNYKIYSLKLKCI